MVLDPYFFKLVSLGIIQLIAVMSPGPDFAIVVRNSLVYSRKSACLTAIGIAAGVTVHIAYSLLGLGLIIAKNLWLFNTVKILGCLYLFYIGAKAIKAGRSSSVIIESPEHQHRALSSWHAFWAGFLTNVLNPKAILFFLSIITTFLDPATPLPVMALYGIEIMIITLLWFLTVAFCFSHSRIRNIFSRFGYWIERLTGGLLIILGIKLAFTEATS
jgi:RhtB (resistance to homoserine/threonine) family protein